MTMLETISIVADIASSFFEHFHSGPVLLPVYEIAFVVITFMCCKLAIPFRSIIEPHAREAELGVTNLPFSKPMLHALIPLSLECLTSSDFV